MEREKKYQHAQYLIGFLNNYSIQNPESQEVVISCGDVRIRTYSIILASASDFVRKLLLQLGDSEGDVVIIIPDLDPNSLETFLRYIFTRDVASIYSVEDNLPLAEVFKTFKIDSDLFSDLYVQDQMLDEPEQDLAEQNIESPPPPIESKKTKLPKPRKRPLIISHKNRESVKTVNDEMIELNNRSRGKKHEKIKCQFCDKSYNHVKARNKHLLSDHFDQCKTGGLIYPCPICGSCFVSVKGLEKHCVRLHDKNNGRRFLRKEISNPAAREELLNTVTRFKCPFHQDDHFLASNLRELKNHVKSSHPDKDKSCYACGEDCGSREVLYQHIQSHTTQSSEARFFYNCEYCQMKFVSEYNLVTHKKQAHSEGLNLHCSICKKLFKNAKYLKSHEAKHSTGEVSIPGEAHLFKCSVQLQDGVTCDKTFKIKSNLDRHVKSHQGIKSHVCDQCGKKFVDSTRLKEHRWIHSGHRPFSCRFCEKSFRHQNHVRNHEANVHGEDKPFPCQICNKRFVYAYQLRTHLNSHRNAHGVSEYQPESPLLQVGFQPEDDSAFVETLFQCSLCQQVLSSYQLLQEHCLHHSERDIQDPSDSGQSNSKDQILIEISDSNGFQGGSQEGQQFVVVYDVPTNE